MYKREDLVDWVMERLAARNGTPGAAAAPAAPAPGPGPKGAEKALPAAAGTPRAGRIFLSEHDIRRRLTGGGKELRIPRGAIISPLAQDWLVLAGVRVVEEP